MPKRVGRRHPRSGASHLSQTKYVDVRIDVPRSVASSLPSSVVASPPTQRQRRTRTIKVPTYLPKEGTVRKKIRVFYQTPKDLRPAYMELDRSGTVRIYSHRRTRRLLAHEFQRPRRQERGKHRTRRASDGQLDSVRDDRYGLLGANRHRSIDILMDAAMVTNALRRGFY